MARRGGSAPAPSACARSGEFSVRASAWRASLRAESFTVSAKAENLDDGASYLGKVCLPVIVK